MCTDATTFWWPNMSEDIEKKSKTCSACLNALDSKELSVHITRNSAGQITDHLVMSKKKTVEPKFRRGITFSQTKKPTSSQPTTALTKRIRTRNNDIDQPTCSKTLDATNNDKAPCIYSRKETPKPTNYEK